MSSKRVNWIVLVLAEKLAGVLRPAGFEWLKREAAFRRSRDGVIAEFRFGISSRPASLGYSGILIEPMLVIAVPEWESSLSARLVASGSEVEAGEGPLPAAFMHLDHMVAGSRPHWVLPDEPDQAAVDGVAASLSDAVVGSAVPIFAELDTPTRILDALASGRMTPLQDARPTIAMGALLAERPDIARSALAPIGTSRRRELEKMLGVPEQ